MTDLADLSLTEMVDAQANGETTSVALTEATLARFETRNPALNCTIRLDHEGAMAAAKAADAKRESGAPLGPLHGVPLAHKDMYYREGVTVTCGSAIRRDFKPTVTATVLERLDAAGALHIGALNMSEFASGPTGHNVHYGACRNPWNTAHITGGSSSGSGSAVAGGLVPASLGSDTGGSIRLPAGICGTWGIKPTQGRVSRHGVMGLSFSLDNVGPLARTARDCARVLSVIAGPDPMDTTTLPNPAEDYEADLDAGVKGLRIAVPSNHYFDDIDPEIGAILDGAIKAFEGLGASVHEVTLPHHEALGGMANAIAGAESCTLHAHWLETCPELYSPLVRGRMKGGFGVSAVEYLKALQVRARVAAEVGEAAFSAADVMLIPMLRFPVPTIEETDVGDGPDMATVLGRITHATRPINYLGFPALSVPAGHSASGLPVGFQLVGPALSERLLFRFGGAFEKACPVSTLAPGLA